MRKRVTEEESGKFVLKAEDYAAALKAEFAAKGPALADLGLDPTKDAAKADEFGKRLLSGRDAVLQQGPVLELPHRRHVHRPHVPQPRRRGDKDGELPLDEFGRFVRLPTGHKDPALVGAFKTPGVRGLLQTGPVHALRRARRRSKRWWTSTTAAGT